MLFSWSMRGLAPDRTLEPAFVAAAWWLSNSILVGTMTALAQRHSVRDGLRVGLTQEGWLRLQEAILSVLAVVVWWTNPLLLLAVVLLVIGQAMTGRRLFHEYEAAAVAREQARRDPLTRLPNRRAFEEELDSRPNPDAVLMFDLDHFKRINDTFGHDAGDSVLVEVAVLVQQTLGSRAFCARLGGEEFCALVADVLSDDELFELAECVRLAVKGLRIAELEQLRVTISIGAARPRGQELTARNAIMRADQALYRAKRHGRDQTQLDVPSDDVRLLAS
jgi:diguanylate cyclase (GGDEF)-like protein